MLDQLIFDPPIEVLVAVVIVVSVLLGAIFGWMARPFFVREDMETRVAELEHELRSQDRVIKQLEEIAPTF